MFKSIETLEGYPTTYQIIDTDFRHKYVPKNEGYYGYSSAVIKTYHERGLNIALNLTRYMSYTTRLASAGIREWSEHKSYYYMQRSFIPHIISLSILKDLNITSDGYEQCLVRHLDKLQYIGLVRRVEAAHV